MRNINEEWPYYSDIIKEAINKFRGDGFFETRSVKSDRAYNITCEIRRLFIEKHGHYAFNDYMKWMSKEHHLVVPRPNLVNKY